MPKVQHFFTQESAGNLHAHFFERIDTAEFQSMVHWKCQHPKRVHLGLLKAAIKHQFNLPWADGESLNSRAQIGIPRG